MKTNKYRVSIQEVKTVHRAFLTLNRVGLAHKPGYQAFNDVRKLSIEQRGGLSQYLNDMLGSFGSMPASGCRFLGANRQLINTPPPDDVSLINYLTTHFTPETLPSMVLVYADGSLRELLL